MTDPAATPALRIATYNTEWFNALFDDAGRFRDDHGRSARYKVTRGQQLAALGRVFRAMDADGIMVIEAPDTNGKRSTVKALERFARHFDLRARKAIIGFPSETEQEIAFLYDPDRLDVRHDPMTRTGNPAEPAPRFDGIFHYDLDEDGTSESMRFNKPPLELAVTTKGGTAFRLIGVHAKSKAAHDARDEAEFVRVSIVNRRKQLAQCVWLRRRIEDCLTGPEPVMVMGDFNDGPGLDEYERLFGRSGIEIVLGEGPPEQRLYDPHAAMALTRRVGIAPTTARFYLAPAKRYFEALLDFIMISRSLASQRPAPVWRIWHPLNDPDCLRDPDLREALLTASDHFPVTIDLAGLT